MNAESQLASFFSKHKPATVKIGKALRLKLRARLPGLNELVYVYERRESLVISYSPTGNGMEGICALALSPKGVQLHFGKGALLSKSDPKKLLQGQGKMVRHIVLSKFADYSRAEIEILLAAAVKLAKLRLDAGTQGSVIIKTGCQKQRERQTTRGTRPTAVRRSARPRR